MANFGFSMWVCCPGFSLMRAPQQSNGHLVPFPGAAILAFGENLAPPVAATRRLLSELPAKPDVPSQVRDIVNGDEHIVWLWCPSIASKQRLVMAATGGLFGSRVQVAGNVLGEQRPIGRRRIAVVAALTATAL
jgi:hypothetical protein